MTSINRILKSIVALVLVTFAASLADETVHSVDFSNFASDKVLLVHSGLSKYRLIGASDLKKHHRDISIRHSGSKDEVLKAIEKALVEQAGIVITRLDEQCSPRRSLREFLDSAADVLLDRIYISCGDRYAQTRQQP